MDRPTKTAAGGWRIARKVAHDRVISTVDPETRHAHKSRSRKQDGFKAHVAAEPDTGLITNATLTKATGPGTGDAAAGAVVLAGDDSVTGPVQVLGDSAYGTGELLADLQEAGHDPVIKPWPARRTSRAGSPSTTSPSTTTTSRCPARPGTLALVHRQDTHRELRDRLRCLPFPGQVHQIRRRPHGHRGRTRADPARAPGPVEDRHQMRADYKQHRPMVERTIAWLTRGARRLRYRGVIKNDAWLQLRAAGINLRQLCTTGLSRTSAGWRIAT